MEATLPKAALNVRGVILVGLGNTGAMVSVSGEITNALPVVNIKLTRLLLKY